MRNAWMILALLGVVAFAGCLGGADEPIDSDGDGVTDDVERSQGSDPNDPRSIPMAALRAHDDVVVIAVVDTGINPYHWDFLAEHMPQHLNNDPRDDLPLTQDPATWLPGHPGADAFASYDYLYLNTTPDDPGQFVGDLYNGDAAEWAKVQQSGGNQDSGIHMRWIPGTKVVGYVNFNSNDGFAVSSHGVGTSSVSVGNLYGSCPSCLLVYVSGTQEAANEWVAKQDWIDGQTNSWGLSLVMRDRIYAGSDVELQKEAVDRGQSIFFSAGNGQANAFAVPNPTLFSSQEGPDWVITVGAVSPGDRSSYSGHGKPADIASIGSGYPSAYGGNGTVTAEGGFGGTSNATPVTAGMYGEALSRIRAMMEGRSRTQSEGVVATGAAACGAANPDCAVADGEVTVHEMREALFRAAEYTNTGWNVAGAATLPQTENVAELTFMAEGHGSYFGKLDGVDAWNAEVDRIVGFLTGAWYEPQDQQQLDWFIADSVCRQGGWGDWEHGYAGATVPSPSPEWPVRSWMTESCPDVLSAAVAIEQAKDRP